MNKPNLVFHFFIHFIADKNLLVTWLDMVICDGEVSSAHGGTISYIDYFRKCIRTSIKMNFVNMPLSSFLYAVRGIHGNKIDSIVNSWLEFDGRKLIKDINEQT